MPTSAALRAKAEELEGVFLAQVLRGLTQGLGREGLLGNPEDDPFAAMLQDEYARLISRSGGIGIADAVLREMLKAQEAA
jgi:Rod binding domain-containing protein